MKGFMLVICFRLGENNNKTKQNKVAVVTSYNESVLRLFQHSGIYGSNLINLGTFWGCGHVLEKGLVQNVAVEGKAQTLSCCNNALSKYTMMLMLLCNWMCYLFLLFDALW